MGVNLGEVGFLNAVSPGECVEAVRTAAEGIERGEAELRELPQIRASGEGWTLPPAVNEVATLGPQRGRNNGLEVEIRADGELYSAGHADGALVSTPTGSSAYNLSEGGPLVHPDIGAFVVTEMCAEGSMPSLAVPIGTTLTVDLAGADNAVAVADGRTRERLDPPTRVTLEPAADPVRVAGPPLEFFAALEKLD
jgi:NAD+ kinase